MRTKKFKIVPPQYGCLSYAYDEEAGPDTYSPEEADPDTFSHEGVGPDTHSHEGALALALALALAPAHLHPRGTRSGHLMRTSKTAAVHMFILQYT